MDSVLPALLAVTIIVLASLAIGRSGFTSFQVLSDSWQDAEARSVERIRSDISITSVVATDAMSGTTDVPAEFSVDENPADYIQAADGQLTIFVVNEDVSDRIQVDDLSVTVTTATGSAVYDYTGITEPSASHTAEDGEIDVSDTVIEDGSFSARRNTIPGWNNWAEADNGQYADLVGSDDSRYRGADPGGGDNAAMIFEFYVAEAPVSITRIDVALEASQGANTDAWFAYLWNYSTGAYEVCCTQIDVVARNDGATAVVDFSRMDVVVQHTLGSSVLTSYMDFTTDSSPQPAPSWRALSISNDVIDPRVLNTGESMTARIALFPAASDGSHWLQVTTELGISAGSFFTK